MEYDGSMPSDVTHPSLLSRVRDPADHAAWREFDAKYRELILRYAMARGLQHSDAEDLRQMVLMGLSKSMRNFRYRPELGRFRDYLGRVLRNAVTKFVSRPRRSVALLWTEDPELAGAAPPPEDDVWEEEWRQHHFRQALASVEREVEPRSVEVFRALLDGATVKDLAREHGVTDQAVYKIKLRVRDRLRERIAEQIREEEFPERDA